MSNELWIGDGECGYAQISCGLGVSSGTYIHLADVASEYKYKNDTIFRSREKWKWKCQPSSIINSGFGKRAMEFHLPHTTQVAFETGRIWTNCSILTLTLTSISNSVYGQPLYIAF